MNDVKVENVQTPISKAEETRVKALGFLKDKRTPDRFNGRVITRNGKLTADEAKTIAEAASLYGSGEVTMTSKYVRWSPVKEQPVSMDLLIPLHCRKQFMNVFTMAMGM